MRLRCSKKKKDGQGSKMLRVLSDYWKVKENCSLLHHPHHHHHHYHHFLLLSSITHANTTITISSSLFTVALHYDATVLSYSKAILLATVPRYAFTTVPLQSFPSFLYLFCLTMIWSDLKKNCSKTNITCSKKIITVLP